MKKIVFCAYHERDDIFFSKIGENLILKGYDVYILYFIKPYIKKSNVKKIHFYDYLKNKDVFNCNISKKLLFHEKNWSNKSFNFLEKKFCNYKKAFIDILDQYKIDIIFQELGGFVCHLSIYEASQEKKITHFFIEPSFLQKYCFFLKNSIEIEKALKLNSEDETSKLLTKYTESMSHLNYLAINFKDLHLKKKNMFHLIFSFYTWKSFFKKIKKNFFFEKSEFKNLYIHLCDFFTRTINFINNLSINYEKINNINNFIYFPLHVPKDLALTLRAPSKLDQINSLKKIIGNTNEKIVFKEHPLIFSRYNYKKILNNFKNAGFLDNNISSNEIIRKAKFIITINSKSGIESLFLQKPVLALEKNYYCGKGLAYYCNDELSFKNFNQNLNKFLPDNKIVNNFLKNLLAKTCYFDLYNNEENTMEKSFKSIHNIILMHN